MRRFFFPFFPFVQALAALAASSALTPPAACAQERGAAAADQDVRGTTVTSRVLMIAAHPDDEDTQLIAFLARGRRVETAYLSLTRGDGGQNLIGNELGESLGAIRTEELLAARRLDGGHQYFTRAFDFGFSKSAEETYKHWDHDSLLADVVTVIRAFRPQVVVSVWSGTPADGHGHHTVAGLVSREAYDAAADTVRFPEKRYGRAWSPLKFYRSARGTRRAGAVGMDVGEYDAVLGRSYAEIAGESRAQHRSQGFGGIQQRKGAQMDYVLREASRVNESTPPAEEKSIFDGIDTTFARLVRAAPAAVSGELARAGAELDSAQAAVDLRHPDRVTLLLARAARLAQQARERVPRCAFDLRRGPVRSMGDFVDSNPACDATALDLDASLDIVTHRAAEAAFDAAGVTIEATAPQELLAFGDSMPVSLTVYNRGHDNVTLAYARINDALPFLFAPIIISPDSSARLSRSIIGLVDSRPWWISPHSGDLFPVHDSPSDGLARVSFIGDLRNLFTVPGVAIAEDERRITNVQVTAAIRGENVTMDAGPVTFHSSDPLLGEQNRPIGGVPAVTLTFDRGLEWMIANKPLDHLVRVSIKSFASTPRTFSFKIVSPPGIRVDSIPPSMTLKPKEEKELFVRLRGQLKAGRYEFGVIAENEDGRYMDGFKAIEYAHIRPIRMYRFSAIYLQAVDITIPATLSVAYIQGVGDNVAPFLQQLGIPVTIVSPDQLPVVDLGRFSTVVVGTRAYEAHRELVAYNGRLLDFAKKGGTLVVQYGQDIATLGVMPYPVTTPRTSRVTVEEAPVTVLDPKSRVLNSPNRIGDADWQGWVQERGLYMPTIIDSRYSAPLEMHDPGEPEIRGGLLVTPLGKGTYVFTSLALFRQIPGGVPGGARLFVNLLSAGLEPERAATKKVQP
jgi:LmbE family N-acetylglucosaminyl deacetylase